ncbi:MAG: DUF1861 family protein, partial [Candidatus Omnitrophota bacterium]|nr:DUF1861 family protein [Candidatus Omnitrophota bacterium]
MYNKKMIKNMQKSANVIFNQPKSAWELFEAFGQHKRLPMGELLAFESVGDKDVYNITAPFGVNGRTYIAGRVDSRKTERDSRVRFFEEKDGAWVATQDTPTLTLQDPFVAKIGKDLVFGGVETFPHPEPHYAGGLGYRTIFYCGESLQTLTRFATGPDLMKDIRLIQLPGGEVAVFTRPQGAIGGRGAIGFMKLPNLGALATTNLLEAKLIKEQFRDDEWGGANELHLLEDNRIGVLCHLAYNDAGGKHYYAMAFIFDPETEIASPLTIIATRKN